MVHTMRHILNYAMKVFDLCIMVSSFAFATLLVFGSRNSFTFAAFMALRIKLSNILLFALLLIVWHIIFAACGIYVSKRLTTRRAEVIELHKATSLAAAFLLAVARIFHIWMVKPIFVLLFWVVCSSLMVCSRLVVRSVLRSLRRRGRNSRFVLVVGTNVRALEFARQISLNPGLGYQMVGFVDDDWSGMRSFTETGNSCCCDFLGLPEFLRHNVVDEAAIYLPLRSYYEHAAQLVALCEKHGITTRFDSQIFNLRTSQPSVQDIDGDRHVLVLAGNHDGWPVFVKRVFDCIVCLLLLVVLAPLFVIVAVLVKCTSAGPVFFRQTRVGLNKRQFTILKFRTMIANAERLQDQLLSQNEMTGPVFKIKRDPRVTPLGRILRRTSIDELPQLLNVLKGDMSLVGPRAMSLRDYQLFDQDWQRRRFSVKPGITCLWQVNGRNSIPFERWMELDIQYIEKWSLWLDFKILARTIPAVVRGSGAA
jgi:exopolysaccharide biosynthesis polyprenyl glycosylphosphotransferase